MNKRLRSWGENPIIPVAALVLVAVVWGATFVVVADAIALYPVYAFLSVRFFIASLAFLVMFPSVLKRFNRKDLRVAVPAGFLLSVGYIFQTLALLPADQGGTTPARTAFLTGMYVVIVPIFQLLVLRKRPSGGTVAGMGLALAGLWFMSGLTLQGATDWVLGDSYVMLSAFAYSAHMLLLGRTDESNDTLALTFVQLLMVALVSGAMSLFTGENAGIPTSGTVWFGLITCGIFASAIAFVIQTWAQQILPPSRVALILISEPAFGGLFGWLVASSFPPREVLGAGLMITGMIVSELISSRTAAREGLELQEGAMEGPPVYVNPVDDEDDEDVPL